MSKIEMIKRHILFSLYTAKWQPGDKVFSAQQLSITLNVPLTSAKNVLRLFVSNHILIAKKRKGFFINPNIFNAHPLSIRYKYGLSLLQEEFKYLNKGQTIKLVKKYHKKGEVLVIVKTTLDADLFGDNSYQKDKTFLHNLATHDALVTKITSNLKITPIDEKCFVEETRSHYADDGLLIAKEKILVDASIWRGFKEVEIN